MEIIQYPKSEPRLPEPQVQNYQTTHQSEPIEDQKDHCENNVEILVEDATFSAAKFRWIQAVNKIREKLRTSELDQGLIGVPKQLLRIFFRQLILCQTSNQDENQFR